jgi:hypothetical protein
MPGNKHVGLNDYQGIGRVLHLPPPQAWTEAARRIDIVDFERCYDPRYPDAWVDYTWDPVTGLLLEKNSYADFGRTHHLFRTIFDWDPATELPNQKDVWALHWASELGISRTPHLRVTYTWDSEENLERKALEYV